MDDENFEKDVRLVVSRKTVWQAIRTIIRDDFGINKDMILAEAQERIRNFITSELSTKFVNLVENAVVYHLRTPEMRSIITSTITAVIREKINQEIMIRTINDIKPLM